MRILYGYFFGKDTILILIWIIVHSHVLIFISSTFTNLNDTIHLFEVTKP